MQLNFEDQGQNGQDRSPSKRGFYTIGALALLMVGFMLYIRVFRVDRVQAKPVEQVRLTTGNHTPIAAPVEVYAPSPPPQPQAESPRPAPDRVRPAQPAALSPEQKMRQEKRLLAHYAPATVPGVGTDGRRMGRQGTSIDDGDMPREPMPNRQTLEVPSQYGQHGQGAGGNVWTRDFYQRGDGQVGVLQRARSPFMIQRGALIPAKLGSPINTDIPGQITAEVIRNIWDTATGKHLLIPAGSTLVGAYDTRIGDGQQRLPNAWDLLILPNGDEMPLAAMPGADRTGVAGMPIEIDNHYFSRVVRSLLITSTEAVASMGMYSGYGGSDDYGLDDAFRREGGQQLARSSQQMWGRGGYRSPTGTAERGQIFLVQVTSPMIFPDAYKDEVDLE